MTADWIAKRRELERAATEGPWRRVTERGTKNHALHDAHDVDIATDYEGVWYEKGDAEFIADARTSLPLALKALEAVLELHRENTPEDGDCQGYTDTGYGYLDSWCVECSEQSGREYGTDFPCATRAAIESALEVSDE